MEPEYYRDDDDHVQLLDSRYGVRSCLGQFFRFGRPPSPSPHPEFSILHCQFIFLFMFLFIRRVIRGSGLLSFPFLQLCSRFLLLINLFFCVSKLSKCY